MKDSTKKLLEQLRELTAGMDLPSFRKEDPKWLLKNLAVRNADHPNFSKARELSKELVKMGLAVLMTLLFLTFATPTQAGPYYGDPCNQPCGSSIFMPYWCCNCCCDCNKTTPTAVTKKPVVKHKVAKKEPAVKKPKKPAAPSSTVVTKKCPDCPKCPEQTTKAAATAEQSWWAWLWTPAAVSPSPSKHEGGGHDHVASSSNDGGNNNGGGDNPGGEDNGGGGGDNPGGGGCPGHPGKDHSHGQGQSHGEGHQAGHNGGHNGGGNSHGHGDGGKSGHGGCSK